MKKTLTDHLREIVDGSRNGAARDLILVIAGALLLIAGAFFIASRFVKPAPPDTMTWPPMRLPARRLRSWSLARAGELKTWRR